MYLLKHLVLRSVYLYGISTNIDKTYILHNIYVNYLLRLFIAPYRTIMARFLTPTVYEQLYNIRTSAGCDIDTCIQPGIDGPDRISCGIVAGDEECYELFSDIFDPVICSRHRGFERGQRVRGGKMVVKDLEGFCLIKYFVSMIFNPVDTQHRSNNVISEV